MSWLGRLIQSPFAQKDVEAEIVSQSTSTSSKKKTALTSADKKKIDKFLDLAKSETIDVKARLAAFRECHAVIAHLPPSADERIQVVNRCIDPSWVFRKGESFSPRARFTTSALSSDPNAFNRLVDSPATVLPDVETVFEEMLQGSTTVEHPSQLSTLTFAFASLVSLCRSFPDYQNSKINRTSGLFDLYPLYGPSEQEARDTVRVIEPDEIGWGLLLPDAFYEIGERLEFLPRATSVLLILFSRNHNTIARQLLEENQQKRWVKPDTLEEGSAKRQTQDDEIYNLAKRVNCALFRKIVTTDFLKGLLGLTPLDDSPEIDLTVEEGDSISSTKGVEFSLLYSWLAMFSEPDIKWVKQSLADIGDDVDFDEFDTYCTNYVDMVSTDRGARSSAGISRRDGESFDDTKLSTILQKATEVTARAFRACGTDEAFQPIETAFMQRARSYKVCTFNKFREAIGLAPYQSFEEWCNDTDVAEAAQDLYESIDNLELYVGLRAEKSLDGEGFRLGETATYALILDIAQVVRSDPAFKEDQKLEEVTKVGAEWIKTNPNNGAFGSSLPNVILSNLPNNYSYNSGYGLYPFVTPQKAKELLEKRAADGAEAGREESTKPHEIDFGEPKGSKTHTVTDADAAQKILDDKNFKNPFEQDIGKLTDGIGILLGFDQDSHLKDQYNTIASLLTEKKALDRYSAFFEVAIRRYLKKYTKKDKSGKRTVNYQDVINGAAAAWAAEILCGVTLDADNKLTTEDFFEKLKTINDTLFGTGLPQNRFSDLKKAKDAAILIRRLISHSLSTATSDPSAEEGLLEWILNLLRELLFEEPPSPDGKGQSQAHQFLARVAASGRNKQELTANILGFAAFSSISFAKTLGTAVSFYLSDDRVTERNSLIAEARKKDFAPTKQTLLGYAREAQRLSSGGRVTLEALEDKTITISRGKTVTVKKGDRVVIDPSKFKAVDKTVDPNRVDNKGPAFFPFIEGCIPRALRTIFALQGIAPEKGINMMTYTKTKAEEDHGFQVDVKEKGTPYAKWLFDVFLVVLVLYFSSTLFTAIGNAIDRVNTLRCANPSHMRPWEVYTLLPGPDNRTAPFIITLNNPQKRRLTFVDIDQRDMRFQVSVNGKKKALSSDFTVDKSLDCGTQVDQCLAEGFSQTSVIMTPGKKVVKLEWVGKDNIPGTNLISWGLEPHRRFMWKQEAC